MDFLRTLFIEAQPPNRCKRRFEVSVARYTKRLAQNLAGIQTADLSVTTNARIFVNQAAAVVRSLSGFIRGASLGTRFAPIPARFVLNLVPVAVKASRPAPTLTRVALLFVRSALSFARFVSTLTKFITKHDKVCSSLNKDCSDLRSVCSNLPTENHFPSEGPSNPGKGWREPSKVFVPLCRRCVLSCPVWGRFDAF